MEEKLDMTANETFWKQIKKHSSEIDLQTYYSQVCLLQL